MHKTPIGTLSNRASHTNLPYRDQSVSLYCGIVALPTSLLTKPQKEPFSSPDFGGTELGLFPVFRFVISIGFLRHVGTTQWLDSLTHGSRRGLHFLRRFAAMIDRLQFSNEPKLSPEAIPATLPSSGSDLFV
jgi:hypothetical protein